MRKLPDNWETVIFEDVFEYCSKSGRKAGEGLDQGKYKFFTSSQNQSKYLEDYDFEGDHLIFGAGGMPSVHHCNEKFSTSTDCFVVKPIDKSILPKYVQYFFKGNAGILERGFRGAGLKHLSRPYLNSVKIPKPPLETQKKIVTVLERAEKLVELRENADSLTDEYLKAVFYEMFGDLSSNSKHWKIEYFDYFANIDTKMTKDFIGYANQPHIGIENIEKGTGKLINYILVGNQNIISGKYIFTNKHIIYSKIRPNLNKVALPNFSGLCSADAYPILVNEKNANRYFFAYILRSEYFLDHILKQSRRANIPKANMEQIRSFSCINPPIDMQNKFGSIVEMIYQLKNQQTVAKTEINFLFNLLMQNAFKGDIIC